MRSPFSLVSLDSCFQHENWNVPQVPFVLLEGDPQDTIPSFVQRIDAGALVCDYSPLRLNREWKTQVGEKIERLQRQPAIPIVEVDAHNVVPVWVASNKLEYAARTIRR